MKKAGVPSILVAVVLLALGVIAEAQQAKKVPRIGYLAPAMQPVIPSVPRQFDWLYASVATSKDRTSPPSTGMRRERSIGLLILLASWCTSRLISSW
jgi:hypothetical protein